MSKAEEWETVWHMTTNCHDVRNEWDAVTPAWTAHADDVESQSACLTGTLLTHLGVVEGDRVLELAAGPGSLGATWSELVGPAGTVLLSDASPAMVASAARRNAGLANVDHAVIDAAAIDLPDSSFDAVACRMGLMFVPDPLQALTEIRRVLRPGGRFAVLTWAGAEHNPWLTCVSAAAAASGLLPGDPAGEGTDVFSLSDPADLAAMAKAAGFVDVEAATIPVAFRPRAIEHHVDQICALAPPLAAVFDGAVPGAKAAVCHAAKALAAPYVTDTGLEIPGLAVMAAGRR